MQTTSANAGFMDLNKASAVINAIPLVKESIPELMQLADGKVPGIPGYLALAKLQQIEQLVKSLAPNQPPQGTIKDSIEQSMATMMTQQGQQLEAQKAQMPKGGLGSLGPVPPNTPPPEMQAEAAPEMGLEQGAEPPMQAAHGGIMNAHVDPRMFNFDGGGIVSFAGGDFIGPRKEYPINVEGEEAKRLANNKRIAERLQDLKNATTPAQAAQAAEAAEAAGASRGMIYNAGKALGNLFRNAGTVLSEGLLSGPGAAAASRIAAPVGAAYTGYEIGREIDERTGIGKDIIDKSGIGSLIDSMYGQSGVKLTPEAQQRADAMKANPSAFEPAPVRTSELSRPGQMTTANDPRTAFANAPPPPPPAAAPRPAPVPTSGPMAGGPAPTSQAPQAPQTDGNGILALAKKLTLDNPDQAQAKADRDAIVPKEFDQAKAITDRQTLNEALGIGTYGKNRREQLAQLKKEFEASQPTSTDRVFASLKAFSRPGARAGDMAEASDKMMETERAARFEFAKAQDLANDALERVDEAVRTGDAAAINAARAESVKANQTAREKKAELSQQVANNTAAANKESISSATNYITASNRDSNMYKIAVENNVSAEKVANIQAAATRYLRDKPDKLDPSERILQEYIERKNKSGEAEADKWLETVGKTRAAFMGANYAGTNKTTENKIKLDDLIRKATEPLDLELAKSNLKPERRAQLEVERRVRENRVRDNYPELDDRKINDPFKPKK